MQVYLVEYNGKRYAYKQVLASQETHPLAMFELAQDVIKEYNALAASHAACKEVQTHGGKFWKNLVEVHVLIRDSAPGPCGPENIRGFLMETLPGVPRVPFQPSSSYHPIQHMLGNNDWPRNSL